MAQFRYKGRDRRGKAREGRIKGDSKQEVTTKLREDGISVMSINELTGILYKEVNLERGVKSQDFVIYLRQFSTLLQAGISVVDATRILGEQTSSKNLKSALEQVEESLRAGNPFSEAAEDHRKTFPSLFINMMKAGEAGGNLDEILDRLATYYEKQHQLRQKIVSTMSYPVVVGLIALVIVIFLLSFVVPTFADMFVSFNADLPAITVFVMSLGDVVGSFWWTLIVFGIGFVVAIKYIKSNRSSKYYLDYFLLKIPIFGKLLQKAILARMTRTLSSLFASSVPILQALSIVERVVGNEVVARVIRDSRGSLEKGESLAAPMEAHWIFPPLVSQMITVGEKTGALDMMLDKVADFYEAEVEASSDQIKSLIEPLMIVFLAVIVGAIVASIAVPMFQIFDEIG